MNKYLLAFLFSFCLFSQIRAQGPVMEFFIINQTASLPETLRAGRSVVVMQHHDRSKWKTDVRLLHRQLIRMSIDPVFYIHYDDFNANTNLTNQYLQLFEQRQISQVILIEISKNQTHIAISPPDKSGLFKVMANGWYGSGTTLNDALYVLALDIKKTSLKNTNFLISEIPEFLETLPILEGTHYPTYPTQLKRLPLAVTKFQSIKIDSTIYISKEALKHILAYNKEIEEKNATLDSIFFQYSFPYKYVPVSTDDELYSQGIQFILRFVHTTGINARTMLGYKTDPSETDYLTAIPLPDERRTLVTIPVQQPIYKYYVKQTVQKDMYVGRHWDAGLTWDEALRNFLMHMNQSFNR